MSLVMASVDGGGASRIPGSPCYETLVPAALRANQNNYGPPGYQECNYWELTASALVNITGIKGGFPGRELVLFNWGDVNNISLVSNSVLSDAANRIDTNIFGPSYAIIPFGFATLRYSLKLARWQLVVVV